MAKVRISLFVAIIFIREALNKDYHKRPDAVEALKNIWFIDINPIPMYVPEESDPNLSETITSISRTCAKSKRIKKHKELVELFTPTKKYPKVRMKFLSIKDHESTYESGMLSM